MNVQHTPGPWSAKDSVNVYHEGRHIADCGCHTEGVPLHIGLENAANAAFIVRACNAHDELVEALTLCLSALDEYAGRSGALEERRLARAAIKKAGIE